MYLDNLPVDILCLIIDKINDNNTFINIILTCKEFKINLEKKRVYEKEKYYLYLCECIENGKRYMRIIEIYNKFKLIDGPEIINLLINSKAAKLEMYEWYSLLKEKDIIYEDRFWSNNNHEFIYKNVEILKKGKALKYSLNIDKYEILLSGQENINNFLGVKSPGIVLIPPRTDIII
jgi:hypothetical protein